MHNWVLSLSFRSEYSTSTNDHIGVCVSCAKAEQTHGSMAEKAAERQHWFDFNISLSLYSLLFHSEQKCHQKKGQKNVTPLTQPDQMASCLFTLFLPFFPPQVVLLSSAGSLWQHWGWSHNHWQEPAHHNQTQIHKISACATLDIKMFFYFVCMALVSSDYLHTEL